jgi:hypothetical protein
VAFILKRVDMSDCSFSITFTESAPAIVEKARKAISSVGGSFNGDTSSGEFSLSIVGMLKGSYRIEESTLHMSIHKRPAFISCGRIEKELRKYVG